MSDRDRTAAAFLAAVGEPTRLKIVRTLASRPKTVTEIAEAVGAPLVNVSHHLGVMRTAGVIVSQNVGRTVVCELVTPSERNNGSVMLCTGGVSVSVML